MEKAAGHPADGRQGLMNAYFNGPRKGPDGRFHLVWMWRDTGDCSTNHDLNYARSDDLVHWQSAGGQSVKLPLTVEEKLTSVDPVPPDGGLLNISQYVGFDHQNNAVVTYHKHDSRGNTQAYAARWENGAWNIVQITDWDYRWDFKGFGSIPVEITLGAASAANNGTLEVPFWHTKYGKGFIVLDDATLIPSGTKPARDDFPADAMVLEDKTPGMAVRTQWDSGKTDDPDVRHLLKWETLPVNRDQPHPGDIPAASMLKVYKIRS